MTASWSGVRRLWDRRREPDKILGQEHVRDIKHKPKSNGSCRHKHKTRCDAGKSLAPSRVPYLYPHSIILDHSADVFSYLSLVVGGEGGLGGEAGAAVAPSCLRPGFQLQTCLPLVSLAFPLFFFSSSSSPFRPFSSSSSQSLFTVSFVSIFVQLCAQSALSPKGRLFKIIILMFTKTEKNGAELRESDFRSLFWRLGPAGSFADR